MDLTARRPQAPAAAPIPKPAAALHSRIHPAHVIDLRAEGAAATPASSPANVAPSQHHAPAAAPKTTAHERHVAQFTDRFEHARQFGRSEHISRFGPDTEHIYDKFGNRTLETLMRPGSESTATPSVASAPAHHAPAVAPSAAMPEMPHQAATQHEAMARLAPGQTPAPPPQPQAPSVTPTWRPHLSLSPHAARIAATTTAVALMAGYVWLQNYPKLAIQAAGSHAGITASLPSYVPSSYNLARTDTGPGLVTLSFTSPSASETLKITQHRTTWDSSSLLDNYIAKNTDDYSTVQGQGLTIFVFNNNQAAWVNHGLWYSIEGAARLSREQILKIAYSL